MTTQQDRLNSILHVIIVVFGIWSLYAQTLVLLRSSFHTLLAFTWLPALAIVFMIFVLRRIKHSPVASMEITVPKQAPSNRLVLLVCIGLAAISLITRPGNWIFAIFYTFASVWILKKASDHPQAPAILQRTEANAFAHPVLWIVIVASMVLALGEHRVNWDDAKYLHIVATTMQYPDEPLLTYEHLHGVDGLKIFHPAGRLQTYEITVAAISKAFGISHFFVYYLLLPPIFAVLSVLAQWILLRRITGNNAALALLSTFVLLAVWGTHRSFGVFSFDYVGRGIFVSFALPALISTTLDFAEHTSLRTFFLLFFATWTACLFTSTAYAVAPVAIVLVLFSCYALSLQKIRSFALATLTFIWCPVILLYSTWIAPVVKPLDVDTPGGAHTVFQGTQGRIALMLFALAPFLLLQIRSTNSKWFLRYSAIVCLLLFNGTLLHFIGKHSSILSWRLLWAVPIPLMIGTGVASAIRLIQRRVKPSLQWLTTVLCLVGLVLAFTLTGKTVAFRNFGWPVVKMDKSVLPVVEAVVHCSSPVDVVLAPPQIAVPMAGFIGTPTLVAVRGHHLAYLSAQWGKEETRRRQRLFKIVQGDRSSREDIAWARDQILKSSINRIILHKKEDRLKPMRAMLQTAGVKMIEMRSWEIWVANTLPPQAERFRSCLENSKRL